MQTSKVSPLTTEKRNVIYRNCGMQSTPANKSMQRMLAAAAITTPSVAACGATTVWANGPIAPPKVVPILNGLRGDALNGSIGSLDMATLHVGALVDKNGLRKRQTYDGIYNRQL